MLPTPASGNKTYSGSFDAGDFVGPYAGMTLDDLHTQFEDMGVYVRHA